MVVKLNPSNRIRAKLALKLLCLVVLLVLASQTFASDCSDSAASGWMMDNTCQEDGFGGARCVHDYGSDSSGTTRTMCLQVDLGNGQYGCTNSRCSNGCILQGHSCTSSFDCCGMNFCENGVCAGGNEW